MSPADSAALVDRTGRADPVVPVVLMNQVDRVDLVAPQVLEAQAAPVDLVAPEAQAVPVAPVVLMDRAVPADHHRRLMFSTVSMTTVARNSAVRKTRRTASAHPTTALRHPAAAWVRLERRATARASAAELGRATASRRLERSAASRRLERAVEWSGARHSSGAGRLRCLQLRWLQRHSGVQPALWWMGLLVLRYLDSALLI